MSKIIAAKRGRRATKRLNLAKVRDVFRDRSTWTDVGIVQANDDGPHFEIDTESGDVLIEVITQPNLIPLTCRLLFSGFAVGIPAAGEEVALIIPGGELDGMPIALPILSSGTLPAGVQEGRVVISRASVWVHDGTGPVEPVAKISELNELRAAFNEHGHVTPAGASGPPSSYTGPFVANPAYPLTDPINQFLPTPATAPTSSVGEFAGTSVFEAK